MASGKKTPALFELIRDPATFGHGDRAAAPPPPPSSPPPSASAAPSSPPRPTPAPTPARTVASEPQPAAPRPSPEPRREPAPAKVAVPADPDHGEPRQSGVRAATLLDPRQRVTIPVSGVYMGIAGLLVVLVAVWWVGWLLGAKDAEVRAIAEMKVPEPAVAIQDPLREAPATRQPTAQPPRQPTGTSAAGPADPREPGLNYLAVEGRLDFDSASRIAEFLTRNGVPSIVVGPGGRLVDRPVAEVNNPVFYTVFALKGITGKEFRDRAPVREELEAEVRRLGQIWKRDHRGTTDFTRTGWSKYNPK